MLHSRFCAVGTNFSIHCHVLLNNSSSRAIQQIYSSIENLKWLELRTLILENMIQKIPQCFYVNAHSNFQVLQFLQTISNQWSQLQFFKFFYLSSDVNIRHTSFYLKSLTEFGKNYTYLHVGLCNMHWYFRKMYSALYI